ncbi:MAG: DUF177 domain-containing protein [Bacteroidales bacterium]|jgi:uncharacterized metal-binding protein YceD (DUF177 family)|nr:DUF177 domain-containing protein [Bacteroidales bacterium]
MKDKDYFKQFDIRFGSLAFGRHLMEVEVNDLFFEKYINEDIQGCNVHVHLTVERKETMVTLEFDMHGCVITFCDRCLEKLTMPISKQEILILKTTGKAKESDNEDIVFLGDKEYAYNIEQILYEYIVTLIPIRKVHTETDVEVCNPEMLKLIEQAKGTPQPQYDERWNVLKDLKLE